MLDSAEKTLPNFLIVGAMKAGTSSIYNYLRQHPSIYMSPIKEPHYFSYDGIKVSRRQITTLVDYCALFRRAASDHAVGEASTTYLSSTVAAERIARYMPNVKLISILRDPVERAYSHYLMNVREGLEPSGGFYQAICDEEMGKVKNFRFRPAANYLGNGFYYRHLLRYLKLFDRSQIAIYLFEDFANDASSVLRDMFRFLGVDKAFVPDVSIKYNMSGIPKSRRFHSLLVPSPLKDAVKCVLPGVLQLQIARFLINVRNQNLVKQKLPEDVRRKVISLYQDDILNLQTIIGRDLSHWMV